LPGAAGHRVLSNLIRTLRQSSHDLIMCRYGMI
jgi:hypothetical protein